MELVNNQTTEDPRLDALVRFDERSKFFPVTSAIDDGTTLKSYTWSNMGVTLDQGREGACTGMSVATDLACRPVPIKNVTNELALRLYQRAKQLDPWPGEDYSGSSLLAAMQAAVELGYYGEYRWAFSEPELALAVGRLGPAIVAIDWYDSMYKTDGNGFVSPSGNKVGRHAICVRGFSLKYGFYILHNTWGMDFGYKGHGKISRTDMATLLASQGEACIPTIRKAP